MRRRTVSAAELTYYRAHFRDAIQEEGVVCLECGALRRALVGHLGTHGLTIADYKAKWGYNRQTGLVGLATHWRMRQRALARDLGALSPPGSYRKALEVLRQLKVPRRLEMRLDHAESVRARLAAGWRPTVPKKVDDETLRALVAEGLTLREMAARTQVDYSTVRNRIRAIGVVSPAIAPAERKATDAELLAFSRAGCWVEEIAARTGMTTEAIQARLRKLRRHGVTVSTSGPTVSAPELAYYRAHLREALRADGVVCLECGAIYAMLGHHVLRQHGLPVARYREKWGYNRRTGLVAPGLRERSRQRAVTQLAPRRPPTGLQKARETLGRLGPISRRPEARLAIQAAVRARLAAGWRPSPPKKVHADVLRELVAEGLTVDQIAARLGVSASTVRKPIRALGLNGPGIAPYRPRLRVTDPELLSLREAGLWGHEIAARTGLQRSSIQQRLRRLRRLGVAVPPPPARPRPNPLRRVSDDDLLAFVQEGLGTTAIAARVGMTREGVWARLRSLRRRGLL
jgi:predicted transcriptional regulator/DNA-binding CsgD family transcriptional regulator